MKRIKEAVGPHNVTVQVKDEELDQVFKEGKDETTRLLGGPRAFGVLVRLMESFLSTALIRSDTLDPGMKLPGWTTPLSGV